MLNTTPAVYKPIFTPEQAKSFGLEHLDLASFEACFPCGMEIKKDAPKSLKEFCEEDPLVQNTIRENSLEAARALGLMVLSDDSITYVVNEKNDPGPVLKYPRAFVERLGTSLVHLGFYRLFTQLLELMCKPEFRHLFVNYKDRQTLTDLLNKLKKIFELNASKSLPEDTNKKVEAAIEAENSPRYELTIPSELHHIIRRCEVGNTHSYFPTPDSIEPKDRNFVLESFYQSKIFRRQFLRNYYLYLYKNLNFILVKAPDFFASQIEDFEDDYEYTVLSNFYRDEDSPLSCILKDANSRRLFINVVKSLCFFGFKEEYHRLLDFLTHPKFFNIKKEKTNRAPLKDLFNELGKIHFFPNYIQDRIDCAFVFSATLEPVDDREFDLFEHSTACDLNNIEWLENRLTPNTRQHLGLTNNQYKFLASILYGQLHVNEQTDPKPLLSSVYQKINSLLDSELPPFQPTKEGLSSLVEPTSTLAFSYNFDELSDLRAKFVAYPYHVKALRLKPSILKKIEEEEIEWARQVTTHRMS